MVAVGVDDMTLWIFCRGILEAIAAAWLVSHGCSLPAWWMTA
jgi:hypothetical protein